MKKLLLFLFLMTISLGHAQGAAPTAPARSAGDVVSIFSGAYTDIGADFYPFWGQGTLYEQVALGGDNALHYSNLDYEGIDFNGSYNVSTMTKLHLDVYTTDVTPFLVSLIAGGENAVTLTPSFSGWNSYDLDLATEYPARNLASAIQIKIEKGGFAYHGESNSIYLDNIYFWRPAGALPNPTITGFSNIAKLTTDSDFSLTTPTSDSAGAFTYTSSNTSVATISGSTVHLVGAGTTTITASQAATSGYAAGSISASLTVSFPPPSTAATTPTVNSADVISVFSGAYTDVAGTNFYPNWGQQTQYALVDVVGNSTLKYSSLNYQGIQLASPINASAMETLHIDIWTPDCTSFKISLINEGIGEQAVTVTPSLSGWNSYDIPLASYNTVNKANIGQFKLEGNGTVYLDNIYFWVDTTPHAPTLGAFTVAAKTTDSADFALTAPSSSSAGAFTYTSSNTAVATISGSTVHIVGVGSSTITATQAAAGLFLTASTTATLVVTVPLLTAPNTASPTPPARNAWDVVSIYTGGGSYTDISADYFPNWGQGTTFSIATPGGDNAIKYSNLDYEGLDFNGIKDLSAMTKLHLDVWTPDVPTLEISLIASGENPVAQSPAPSQWVSYDIDLATSYPTLTLSQAIQLKFVKQGFAFHGETNSVYLDNIYFYRPATGFTYYVDADGDGYGAGAAVTLQPSTAPTGYSVNSTDCDDTHASAHPGGTEIYDGIDNDCDGTVDNVTVLSFCKGATVATAAGSTDLALFAKSTGGIALVGTTPLKSAVYYAIVNGSSRTAVTITVNLLPTTPSPLVLTSGVEVIKKVGNFIGTSTALTLTATAVGVVATDHYNWTLPTDVAQVSGGSTGTITVNFAAVTPGNTSLDFLVSSVSADGCVSKTAKKLTVSRSEPGKPKKLTLTDAELPLVLKITKLGAYTGALNTRTLTLTAEPETKAGSQATSYKWVLPAGVTTTATAAGVNTYTSTLPTIAITLAGVTTETTFLFQVYGVNGNGTSLLSKDLTCTSAAPKTPAIVASPSTTFTVCSNSTYTATDILGATYNWTVPAGASIVGSTTGNVIVVDFSAVTTAASYAVTCSASNGTGTSAVKSLTIKKAASCKIAPENVTADEFRVIAYPNPSSSEFTIEASSKGATNVQVYDMTGRLIENRQATSNTVQVGSRLSSGIYNVIVNQGAQVKTLRLIKR